MSPLAIVRFWVPGAPQPGGSKRGFVNPKTGRVVIIDDAKYNREWRTCVAAYARAAFADQPVTGPLRLEITFVVRRPKGHWGTGRNAGSVKASAPMYPGVRPDLTTLLRSTEDALTGILWVDDAQIVEQLVRKRYGHSAGARIILMEMGAIADPCQSGETHA